MGQAKQGASYGQRLRGTTSPRATDGEGAATPHLCTVILCCASLVSRCWWCTRSLLVSLAGGTRPCTADGEVPGLSLDGEAPSLPLTALCGGEVSERNPKEVCGSSSVSQGGGKAPSRAEAGDATSGSQRPALALLAPRRRNWDCWLPFLGESQSSSRGVVCTHRRQFRESIQRALVGTLIG